MGMDRPTRRAEEEEGRTAGARRERGRTVEARRRLSAATDRARRESERARVWAEDARSRSPVVALGFDLVERDKRRLGGLLAGALAYRLFIWLLPFTLLLVGLLGAVTDFDSEAPGSLASGLGLPGVLGGLVKDSASERGWWIAIIIGIAGTAYAGIGVVRALRLGHAVAWGLRPGRMAAPLKVSLWFSGVTAAVLLAGGLAARAREASGAWGLVATMALTLVYFAIWLRISALLPNRATSGRALVPGAVLMALGLQGLHIFTVYYLAGQAERATSVYGAIGAALVLLLWLFLVARLAVAGAVLNAHLALGREERARDAAEEDWTG